MSDAPPKYSAAREVSATPTKPSAQAEATAPRDPRFSKDADRKAVLRNYEFILAKREAELAGLEKQLKQDQKNEELKQLITRQKQKIGQIASRTREAELRRRLHDAENDAVSNGKQRFFMSKKQLREVVSANQFKVQQERGKAATVMKRRGQKMSK